MAQMTKCKGCGAVISEQAAACPQCGHPMKQQRKPIKVGGFLSFLLLLVVFVIAYQIGTGPSTTGSSAATQSPKKAPPKDIPMGGEFSSMKNCVDEIERNVGPLQILKDTPDSVLGRTREDKTFWCNKKVTGTRGTYFEGGYTTSKN